MSKTLILDHSIWAINARDTIKGALATSTSCENPTATTLLHEDCTDYYLKFDIAREIIERLTIGILEHRDLSDSRSAKRNGWQRSSHRSMPSLLSFLAPRPESCLVFFFLAVIWLLFRCGGLDKCLGLPQSCRGCPDILDRFSCRFCNNWQDESSNTFSTLCWPRQGQLALGTAQGLRLRRHLNIETHQVLLLGRQSALATQVLLLERHLALPQSHQLLSKRNK